MVLACCEGELLQGVSKAIYSRTIVCELRAGPAFIDSYLSVDSDGRGLSISFVARTSEKKDRKYPRPNRVLFGASYLFRSG